MPRVLHIVNRLNLGGITYNAASIASRLRPEFDTQLIAGVKESSEESSEFMVRDLGIDPIIIGDMHREINLKKDWKAYVQILKAIKDFQPDIVHTHAAKAGMLGRLAAWRAGVPVIVHTFHGHVFHSYFGKFKTYFFLSLERLLSRISTAIIAISEKQKHELCNVYKACPSLKTHIVELGYDLEPFLNSTSTDRIAFREKYHLQDDTLAVGLIGRVVPIKNLKFFIDCWVSVSLPSGNNNKAFIIGDGEQRAELQDYCVGKGLTVSTPEHPDSAASVVFTSWIYPVHSALAGLDIVALTSLNEGTPASLIEAQAAGKPIVATEVGGVSNIVIPGQTALLSKTGDKQAFCKNLEQLLNDASQRAKMARQGPPYVKARFHYTRLTRDMQKLYRQLLSERAPRK